ncbi:hypothetical protein Tco_1406691 [Tanacetum coccineum]
MQGTIAMVQEGKLWFKLVRWKIHCEPNQGRPFQRNNARGNGVAGNVGAPNRGGMINPGQVENPSSATQGTRFPTLDDDVDVSTENVLELNEDLMDEYHDVHEMHKRLYNTTTLLTLMLTIRK